MQAPSVLQFFMSLVCAILFVLVARAFVLWFFGVNKLLAKLDQISGKLGADPVVGVEVQSFPLRALRSIKSRFVAEKKT